MMVLPFMASAQGIEVKNADNVTIYYNYISSTELQVTFRGSSYNDYSNEYQGNVVIPEEVTYMNRTLNWRECVLRLLWTYLRHHPQ